MTLSANDTFEAMTTASTISRLEIIVNGQPRQVAASTTLALLLRHLEIPERGVAVEINGQIVPRARHAEQFFAGGERLEIVSLIGGG
jgi:sulfur carrier protein